MPTYKLTRAQVIAVRQMYRQHVPQKEIADAFGVTRGAISEIVRGKTWGLKNISRGKASGADNGSTKLKPADVIEIRFLHSESFSQSRLAALFGVSQSAISHIVTGKKWGHLPQPEPIPNPIRRSK
jgi:predicted XRE-type DNA-binding protein